MPENRNREYQSSVSDDSPVERRRLKPRLAGETQRARPSETEFACYSVSLAQNPISSSRLPDWWRHRTRKIPNTERERRLRCVNCRLRIVAGRECRAEIAFRTNYLRIRT